MGDLDGWSKKASLRFGVKLIAIELSRFEDLLASNLMRHIDDGTKALPVSRILFAISWSGGVVFWLALCPS
jgi:hypothetical protein